MTAIPVPHLATIHHHDHLPRAASGDAGAPARLPSKRAVWTGRILSGIAVLFLLFDAASKILRLPPAVQATVELGYSPRAVMGLGLLALVCLVAYVVPRTAIVGAVLWTGYCGGAIATQVRVGHPLFSHTLFPVYLAALIWGGLWLRDSRLRACARTSLAKRERPAARPRRGAASSDV